MHIDERFGPREPPRSGAAMDKAKLEEAMETVRVEWDKELAWLRAPDATERLEKVWESMSAQNCVVIAGKGF